MLHRTDSTGTSSAGVLANQKARRWGNATLCGTLPRLDYRSDCRRASVRSRPGTATDGLSSSTRWSCRHLGEPCRGTKCRSVVAAAVPGVAFARVCLLPAFPLPLLPWPRSAPWWTDAGGDRLRRCGDGGRGAGTVVGGLVGAATVVVTGAWTVVVGTILAPLRCPTEQHRPDPGGRELLRPTATASRAPSHGEAPRPMRGR